MKPLPLPLLLFLSLSACSQAPKKQYRWTSLSEKGFIQNTLTVLQEDHGFETDNGFEGLELKKHPPTPISTSTPTSSPSADIKKIVLIGDTGCRLKEGPKKDSYQNCKDPKAWGYPKVVDKIIEEKPDLILHFGDYHYREQCSEGKVCRQYTNVVGKGWRAWEADFFLPSQKALNAAPWLFIRGNHENCYRAFEGYKLLTEQTWEQNCIPMEKTEYLLLGDVLLVNMDTSSISDKPESAEILQKLKTELHNIEAQLKKTPARRVWLVTHKPLIALLREADGSLVTTNINLQKLFVQSPLSEKIELLFAGHLHSSQFIQAEKFPPQIVVGHSGTVLDDDKAPKSLEALQKNKIDHIQFTKFFTDTQTPESFGYAVLTRREDQSWQLQFKSDEAQTTFTQELPGNLSGNLPGNLPGKKGTALNSSKIKNQN